MCCLFVFFFFFLGFSFGLLGIQIYIFLMYMLTFWKIYKKKSTEGFRSLPYSVALFSATLNLYYAFLKTSAVIFITVNSIGCAMEFMYLIIYIIYAPAEKTRIYLAKFISFNLGLFGLILLCTSLIDESHHRLIAVGWICSIFSVCAFAAPFSIMRQVIKTKSVEFMPFSLSLLMTIRATTWFLYGLLIKDFFVAVPNILGFIFGIAQMILYVIYMDKKKDVLPEFTDGTITNDIQLSTTETLDNLNTTPNEMEESTMITIGIGGAPTEPSFIFGIAQMILYIIYKDKKNYVLPEFKLQDVPNGTITNGIQLSTIEILDNLKTTPNEMEESKVITKGIGSAPTEPS
ncbi:bidirectional sugar transporter NEC1-like [Fagus crenata]